VSDPKEERLLLAPGGLSPQKADGSFDRVLYQFVSHNNEDLRKHVALLTKHREVSVAPVGMIR
jgi:hypothetical protein